MFLHVLHVLTCSGRLIHVFGKKRGRPIFGVFKTCSRIVQSCKNGTCNRLDIEERQRRELRALGLLPIFKRQRAAQADAERQLYKVGALGLLSICSAS